MRHRPLQRRQLRDLSRRVWRGHVHRQGTARRSCRARGAVRPVAARPGAEPRSARRLAGPLRGGERHHGHRRRAVPCRRGRIARAPLDARRLAAAPVPVEPAALAPACHQPLEDVRQLAPLARGADVTGLAGAGAGRVRGVAGGRAGAGAGGLLCRAADGCRGGLVAQPGRHRQTPLLQTCGDRPGARRLGRAVARGAVAGPGADGNGCGGAGAVPHGRQPPAPAAVDDRRRRAGIGPDQLRCAAEAPSPRAGGGPGTAGRVVCRRHAAPGAGGRAVPGVGRLAGVDLVGQPPAPGTPRRRLASAGPDLPGRRGTRHLAPVRALRGGRGKPPAARQPADRPARHGGAPHVAHQHRPVPAERGLRTPVRLDHDGRADGPAGGHAAHRGHAAAAPWPPAELVRHANLRAAAADVRVHGGQRQPQRPPARRGAGLPGAGHARASRRGRHHHPTPPGARNRVRAAGLVTRLRLSLPPQAAPVSYRLPSRRAAARCRLLRSAGVRGAPDQPAGHRQGRRSGEPLGIVGPALLCRRRRSGAALVVGLDVRVPDADPGARRTPRQRAARCLQRGAARADRLRQRAGRSLGPVRVGLCRQRPHAGLSIFTPGRAAPRAAPHAPRRTGCRTLCHRAGGPDRTAPRVPELQGARSARRARALRLHRSARLHAGTAGGQRGVHAGQHLHGPPPGHDHRRAGQRVAGRRGATMGHGQRPHRGGGLAAARARTTRGVDAVRARCSAATAHAVAAPATRFGPAARGVARRSGARADACAGQWALQREPACQRCWLEPLGRHRHHPLARRRTARCAWQLLLPAAAGRRARAQRGPATAARRGGGHGTGNAGAAVLHHPAPGAGPGRALPQHLPRRPRVLRRGVARAAGPHDRVGQPGGRHRVPPGRVAKPE